MKIPKFVGDITIFPHVWDLEIEFKGQTRTYDVWFDFKADLEEGESFKSGHDGEPVSYLYDYIENPKVTKVYRVERMDEEDDDHNLEDELYAAIVAAVEEHIEENSEDFIEFVK